MAAQEANYPIALMAKVLGVTRAGFYAWKKRGPGRDKRRRLRMQLDRLVEDVFNEFGGVYGAPRVAAVLKRRGTSADVKTVSASMRRMGLEGLSTRKWRNPKSRRDDSYVHPDRCERSWDKGTTDRVWITDFTYLRTGQGWVYLVAVRDAHSRRVLGHALGHRQDTDLLIEALDQAIATRGGVLPGQVVLHADRGCQFTSRALAAYADKVGLAVSMGRTGVCWDNAMAESFWATLKVEYFYRHRFATMEQAADGVTRWIETFYNRKRIHSSLGYLSPIEYELKRATQDFALAA